MHASLNCKEIEAKEIRDWAKIALEQCQYGKREQILLKNFIFQVPSH